MILAVMSLQNEITNLHVRVNTLQDEVKRVERLTDPAVAQDRMIEWIMRDEGAAK
jgi:hypothetical protein